MTPGPVVRAEGQPPVDDPAVNQAYDNFGDTYKFYWEVLHRDSIDDQGMPIHGMVHFDTDYNNAFWDGEGHMWFGDGDGTMFSDFTKSLDVIGHELTHGVTQYTANLAYSGQSGALNESLSDVFGSLVKQYALQQTAEQADWLIGADVVGPRARARAALDEGPGHREPVRQAARGHERLRHHQPRQRRRPHQLRHPEPGVLPHGRRPSAASRGRTAGRIWYAAMNDARLRPNSRFAAFAQATVRAATAIGGGADSDATKAVTEAWRTVKVL